MEVVELEIVVQVVVVLVAVVELWCKNLPINTCYKSINSTSRNYNYSNRISNYCRWGRIWRSRWIAKSRWTRS